jgi:hypothetical protein
MKKDKLNAAIDNRPSRQDLREVRVCALCAERGRGRSRAHAVVRALPHQEHSRTHCTHISYRRLCEVAQQQHVERVLVS